METNKGTKEIFKEKMKEIERFCDEHGISCSSRMDSYYFTINEQMYRVSNHSVESSPYWRPFGRLEDVKYIHASKTRIKEIYESLSEGKKLDGHGHIIG